MRKGFSIIEAVAVLVVLFLAVAMLAPILARTGGHGGCSVVFKEGVNLRNIEVAMQVYASANKDRFPGLTPAGDYTTKPFEGQYYAARPNADNAAEVKDGAGCTLSAGANLAYALLLEDNGITPAQMVSPGETGQTSSGPFGSTPCMPNPVKGAPVALADPNLPAVAGEVRDAHSSFAMLAYGRERLKPEWNVTGNGDAVVLATRLIFNAKAGTFNTVWTDADSGLFLGSVVRNDGSTAREKWASGALASSANPFASLHYGPVSAANPAFAATTESTAVVGVFGRSTDGRNFDATSMAGQIGSVHD